jgi:pyruvate carboxylase subunit B
MKQKVNFMCTAFRDGFQSAYGARVYTKDFIPALEAAKDAGITYFEAGGGARFQSLYFYCREDAFDMMNQFRATVGPEANLQTLSRGVNVVGLESQSSDIIDLHAKLFKKHGMTTIRNFDALNDAQNLIESGKAITNAGLKHQVCVTMMELPPGCTGAHDAEFYKETLQSILDADIPFDSVCFKDASGTAVPSKVYESIKMARQLLPEKTWIHFHTHETAGIGVAANQAALEAGANAIDLSLAPCSGGTCQPDLLVMWHALRGTKYDLDIDVDKIREAQEVFKDCMKDYFLPPEALAVEPMIPWSPMPGGALTANTQMLRDNNIMNKYPEIIAAMKEVVEKGGFGTSVTPVSQFYFQQAFNNVMFGKWKKIAPSYGEMVLGYFGKTPSTPDSEVIKIAADQLSLEPTTRNPLDMNNENPKKGIAPAKKTLEDNNLETSDENIFIVAACGEKGLAFLQGKGEDGVRKIDPAEAQGAPSKQQSDSGTYSLNIEGKQYNVKVSGKDVTVNGRTYQVSQDGSTSGQAPASQSDGGGQIVSAEMPGKVIRIETQVGDHVNAGDPIVILEAMKMEMTVSSPISGTISEISVNANDQIETGQALAHIA